MLVLQHSHAIVATFRQLGSLRFEFGITKMVPRLPK